MGIEEVRERVEMIRQSAGNDEVAHSMQDTLYLDVLREVALGNPHAQALATEAVKVDDIEFERWCA